MKDGEVSGLASALINKGHIQEVSALGLANSATASPVRNSTIFEAASLSKPVVAYAVMKLVDSGRLRLDSTIADYAEGGVLAADPRWKRITVRMLLSHQSGLPNELHPRDQLAIAFEPGSQFSYSGVGYSFLQKAIESTTKLPFEAYVEAAVFRPLGMKDSSFEWRQDYEDRKATGHDNVGRPTSRRKPEAAKAPSSLHTTARDYAAFLRAVLLGEGLSQASHREMLRPQVPAPENCVVCVGKTPGVRSENLSWALGWGVEKRPSSDLIFHWGENNGDFQAFVIGDVKRRDGLVILTNSGNGLSIVPALVKTKFAGEHPAFKWMGYDPYDSPARAVQRRILALDAEKVLRGAPSLTESQWNRIGYQLLARGRPEDAIRVFSFNAATFANSANAHDSLGEAYLAAGRKPEALKSYQRSLALDPHNENARSVIAKLTEEPVQ
ncbi:MAG TPA: serine hydrolase [Caulobacteraceae bacterium]|jgi:CubicO group peptidase (beta-lactamase class C family)